MATYILSSTRLLVRTVSIHRKVFESKRYQKKIPLLFRNVRHVQFSTKADKNISSWSEWRGIVKQFIPIGLCLAAVMQWRAYRKRFGERTAHSWEINCYCLLPLRTVSKCWGWIADKQLPEWLRPYVYGLYIRIFDVNLREAAVEDLTHYPSLAEFFVRPLKNDVRAIDQSSPLVSPCDGTVLHFGSAKTGQIEQVKGVNYSLENFLGENTWNRSHEQHDYQTSLLHKDKNSNALYQCVLYLAPGDYHRFHSPTDWTPMHRRHFTGKLLSVNPSIARWLPGLFCLNERVVYVGHWEHGFFSFTAVGATNVGSVKVYIDKSLQTNQFKRTYHWKDKCLGSNISLKKGDLFGEFRMGSTVVLIFEAPQNFTFNLQYGQRIKMGESLGAIQKTKHVDKVQTYNKEKINIK